MHHGQRSALAVSFEQRTLHLAMAAAGTRHPVARGSAAAYIPVTSMIIVLMGVTGAGKTTVGLLLAKQLSWQFADADDFHSAANIDKMRRGIPLTDADREPWLEALRAAILRWVAERKNVILACSALKQRYRERLRIGPEIKLVYLKGSYDLIFSRLQNRHGHFATASILAGQFADLEEPSDAVIVSAADSPEQIAAGIRHALTVTSKVDED
jgi:gluconokinase